MESPYSHGFFLLVRGLPPLIFSLVIFNFLLDVLLAILFSSSVPGIRLVLLLHLILKLCRHHSSSSQNLKSCCTSWIASGELHSIFYDVTFLMDSEGNIHQKYVREYSNGLTQCQSQKRQSSTRIVSGLSQVPGFSLSHSMQAHGGSSLLKAVAFLNALFTENQTRVSP